MSILKIAKMGHPALYQVAEKVSDPKSPEIAKIVKDMLDTLEDAGGLGLAAPQVHISKRIVVFFVPDSRTGEGGDDQPEGLTVMVNPEIEPLTNEVELDWEACLSLPDLMGSVPRFTKICYRWTDLNGSQLERVAGGFHARAVQHECDHLDGILYPMRMSDFSMLGYADQVNRNPDLLSAGSVQNRR